MLFCPASSSSELLASSSSSSSPPVAFLSNAAFFFYSSRWAAVYLVLIGFRVVTLAPPLARLATLEVRVEVVVEFAAAPAGFRAAVPVVVVLGMGRLTVVVVVALAVGLLETVAFAVEVVAFWCNSVVGLLTVPLFAVAAAEVADGFAFDLALLLSIFVVFKFSNNNSIPISINQRTLIYYIKEEDEVQNIANFA